MLYVQRNFLQWDWLNQDDYYKHETNTIRESLANQEYESILLTDSPWEHPHIKEKNIQEFNHKCAYCECKLNKNSAKLSFYRPFKDAKQIENTSPSDSQTNFYYSWLKWEWRNLYPACSLCLNSKGFFFPTKNERVEPGTYDVVELAKEEPLLLNPSFDNPNLHLEFQEGGTVRARQNSVKGETTIRILDLNRPELCQARYKEIEHLKRDFQYALLAIAYEKNASNNDRKELIKEVNSRCDLNEPFAGMKRQLVLSWLETLQKFLKYEIDNNISDGRQLQQIKLDAMRRTFLSLQINEFHDLLQKLKVWFQQPQEHQLENLFQELEVFTEPTPEWLVKVFEPNPVVIKAELVKLIEILEERIPKTPQSDNQQPDFSQSSQILQERLEAFPLQLREDWKDIPKQLFELKRWVQGTKAALLTIADDVFEDVKFKAVIAFVDAFTE